MFLPASSSTIKRVSEENFSFSVDVLNTAPQKSASKIFHGSPHQKKIMLQANV